MIALRKAVQEYVAMRRGFGFKLDNYENQLLNFLDFLERTGEASITVDAAVKWACLSLTSSAKTRSKRLALVRVFAEYAYAFDPRTEIPSPRLLPPPQKRPAPFIYKEGDVRALIAAARELPGPLRSHTYSTLIGLLAATGMRLGEAVRLERGDINVESSLLVVRKTKFGKTRLVPLEATTIAALQAYAATRDRIMGRPRCPTFFLTDSRIRLYNTEINRVFANLLRRVGLPCEARHRPRMQDFRHTFAVRTLIDWHRNGEDVQRRLPFLSTYIGHVSPANTYWYLTAVPELVILAAQRVERQLGGLP